MSETMTLESVPSTTGWIAIVENNFDSIEEFINLILMQVCFEDQPIYFEDEMIIHKVT